MATYRLRDCAFFGKSFRPTSSRAKHCAPECRFSSIAAGYSGAECWNWPLSVNKESGYGQFALKASPQVIITAHRMSHATFIGPIQAGMCVMHKCDNRRCFNPSHLVAGTLTDNNRDMATKGRHWAAYKAAEVTAKAWRTRRGQTTSRNRTPAP